MHKYFVCYIGLCDTSSVSFLGGRILYHAVFDIWTIDDNATVAERIRFYRRKGNMDCNTLAELIGVSRFSIMRYECGETEPTLSELKNMAAVFDIEVDKLFDDYYRFLAYPYTAKLKEMRKEKKLTQGALADILGVTANTVKRWEWGQITVTRKMWTHLVKLEVF